MYVNPNATTLSHTSTMCENSNTMLLKECKLIEKSAAKICNCHTLEIPLTMINIAFSWLFWPFTLSVRQRDWKSTDQTPAVCVNEKEARPFLDINCATNQVNADIFL